MTHILGFAPTRLVQLRVMALIRAQCSTPLAQRSQHKALGLLDGNIRESVGKKTLPIGMLPFIRYRVEIGRPIDVCRSFRPAGFDEVGFAVAIYVLQRFDCVEGDAVGSITNLFTCTLKWSATGPLDLFSAAGTILTMQEVVIEMSSSPDCGYCVGPAGELSEEGARISCQRVEDQAINHDSQKL